MSVWLLDLGIHQFPHRAKNITFVLSFPVKSVRVFSMVWQLVLLLTLAQRASKNGQQQCLPFDNFEKIAFEISNLILYGVIS